MYDWRLDLGSGPCSNFLETNTVVMLIFLIFLSEKLVRIIAALKCEKKKVYVCVCM